MSLPTKIRRLREQKGWSQLDVAHQLDVSQAAYNKWEAGQSKPTIENLQKLAEVFEIDFIDLLQDQVPNIDLSNAKFENSPCLVFDSTINTLNYDSPEFLSKILDNQNLITKLIESQNKLIEGLLKK